jgi:dihydroorotase
LLTDELVKTYDSVYKVNPPLRTQKDVDALRAALIDGTIDIIATDHAPHPIESKDCEWSAAAFGMLGLEIAASVAQEVLIESGKSSWQRLAEVLSLNPAEIAGDSEQGNSIEIGAIANIALINPVAKRTVVADTASKSKNSPYVGLELPGQVVHTIYRGFFTVKDGNLAKAGRS